MRRKNKDDIELYRDHDQVYPSINVKVYRFGQDLKPEDFHCEDSELEKALEYAFESAQGRFWEDAPEIANEIFPYKVKVYSAGRCGGHLIVDGLDPVESWDAIQCGRWFRFEKQITDLVQWLCADEQIREDIEVNQWTKPGAELYNFYQFQDGHFACIADLKQQAAAAGFGPVIRP